MKSTIQNFKVIYSTSTTLCIEITDKIRLYGQRHSNRCSGSSVWETWFEQFATWKCHENVFDRNVITLRKKWGISRYTTFRGVRLVKTAWSNKQHIVDAINSVPTA